MSSFDIFSLALVTEHIWFLGAVLTASFKVSANAIFNPSVKVVKGYNKKALPRGKQGRAILRVAIISSRKSFHL